TSIAFSPDGNYLVSGDADGNILVWDTDSWKPVKRFINRRESISCIAISPDGEAIAVGYDSQITVVLSRNGGQGVHTLDGAGCPSVARGVAFSTSSTALFTGGNRLRKWSLKTGECEKDFFPHQDCQAISLAENGNGKWLATGDSQWTVRLWEVRNGQQNVILG